MSQWSNIMNPLGLTPNPPNPLDASNSLAGDEKWVNGARQIANRDQQSGQRFFAPEGYSFAKGGLAQRGKKPSRYPALGAGRIKGKGTGTSDSIPAKLPGKSFVIPAAVVKRYGNQFFDQLEASVDKENPRETRDEGGKEEGYAFGGQVSAQELGAEQERQDREVNLGRLQAAGMGDGDTSQLSSVQLAGLLHGDDKSNARPPGSGYDPKKFSYAPVDPSVDNTSMPLAKGGLVPAKVSNGERLISPEAVNYYGADFFTRLIGGKPPVKLDARGIKKLVKGGETKYPLLDWEDNPPDLKKRLASPDTQAVADSNNAALRDKIAANNPTQDLKGRIAATPTGNPQPLAEDSPLRGRLGLADRTVATEAPLNLKARMQQSQIGASEAASNLLDKGYGGTRFNPEKPIPKPSLAVNDPWAEPATSNNLSRVGNNLKTVAKSIVTDPVNIGMAADTANQALLNRDISKGDIGLGTVARGALSLASRGPRAIAEQVTGGIAKNSPAAKAGRWATTPLDFLSAKTGPAQNTNAQNTMATAQANEQASKVAAALPRLVQPLSAKGTGNTGSKFEQIPIENGTRTQLTPEYNNQLNSLDKRTVAQRDAQQPSAGVGFEKTAVQQPLSPVEQYKQKLAADLEYQDQVNRHNQSLYQLYGKDYPFMQGNPSGQVDNTPGNTRLTTASESSIAANKLAEDRRQFDKGGNAKPEPARYKPDDIVSAMNPESPVSEIQSAQDIFTNPKSRGYQMAQKMLKDLMDDPASEDTILSAFTKASGISKNNLVSILRYQKNQ